MAVERHIRTAGSLHTLDLAFLEALSALRRKLARGELDRTRAEQALSDLTALPLRRHPAAVMANRIWSLRETHTAYDAAYVALAEALRAPLVTTDSRLASSQGHSATILAAAV